MNKISFSLLVCATQATLESSLKTNGSIPIDSLMQNNPSHWKKVWPEGIVDNGDEDAGVLDAFLYPVDEKLKKKKKAEAYPWAFDEDVISTDKSIATAEEITKAKLNPAATKNGGLDMINVYDNTKVVFESGLPYGATW